MTNDSATSAAASSRSRGDTFRLHRFTADEFQHMTAHGVIPEDGLTEFVDGRLFSKRESGTPHDRWFAIPPPVIAKDEIDRRPQRRFTVAEYHRLIDCCALHPAQRTELVEGWVVDKMPNSPQHDSTLHRTGEVFRRILDSKWRARIRCAVVMSDGEPEPDLAIVPGPIERFAARHPGPSDVALLVEIADNTLAYDRGPKLRDYARHNIARCWIVNLVDRRVEVYEQPSGPANQPTYRACQEYIRGTTIPLVLPNSKVRSVSSEELFAK